MTEATLIYLAGREFELRDISAAAYLSAKAEAAEIAAERGTDGEDEALIFAACLTAKGLFDGGERAFQNGVEALEGLSAREIVFAAEEYAVKLPKTAMPEEITAPPAENGKAPERESGEEFMTAQRIKETDTAPVYARKYGFTPEMTAREAQGGQVFMIRESAAEPTLRESMRETSDFFRRDSRRYDGEFERY